MENSEKSSQKAVSEEERNSEIVEQRLNELEAKILEQEHRPFMLITNYINRKRRWKDKHDKRRSAVKKAILWRLFFSPTVIAIATGGLLGYFSLFFMWKQTQLFNRQNELFELQNIRIEQQTHLIEADRRAAQMFIMGEVLSDINRELEAPENSNRILSSPLVGRIISLSRAMKPYRYLENDNLSEELSPERGQLLISLVESKMDSTFFIDEILAKCNFMKADLRDANLRNANLGRVNLMGANLSRTDLVGANLNKAKLYRANLSEANLFKVDLSGANLRRAKLIKAQLPGTDLTGVKFDKSNLIGVNLMSANLNKASLTHVNLSRANLILTDLSEVDLEGVILNKADLGGTNLAYTSLKNIRSLDSLRVYRNNWLLYIKDSLKLPGAEEIYKNYRMDSITNNGHNIPIIVKINRDKSK